MELPRLTFVPPTPFSMRAFAGVHCLRECAMHVLICSNARTEVLITEPHTFAANAHRNDNDFNLSIHFSSAQFRYRCIHNLDLYVFIDVIII